MNYIHIQYTDTICLEVSLTQVSVNNVTDLWLPRGAREYYYAIMSLKRFPQISSDKRVGKSLPVPA